MHPAITVEYVHSPDSPTPQPQLLFDTNFNPVKPLLNLVVRVGIMIVHATLFLKLYSYAFTMEYEIRNLHNQYNSDEDDSIAKDIPLSPEALNTVFEPTRKSLKRRSRTQSSPNLRRLSDIEEEIEDTPGNFKVPEKKSSPSKFRYLIQGNVPRLQLSQFSFPDYPSKPCYFLVIIQRNIFSNSPYLHSASFQFSNGQSFLWCLRYRVFENVVLRPSELLGTRCNFKSKSHCWRGPSSPPLVSRSCCCS